MAERSLQEQWGRLNLASADTAILVLDASQSARECRPQILALARTVLDRLPARMHRRLFFLGSRQSYPADLNSPQTAQWFAAHESRASLITPVFEALASVNEARLAVIGSGRIFDLEDWRDQPVLHRTLLASFNQPLAAPGLARELQAPDAQEVSAHLFNPAERVTIAGPGFLPFAWDHSEFQLEWAADGFTLAGSEVSRGWLSVGFLLAPGAAAEAQVTYANGEQQSAELETTPPMRIERQYLATLTPAEIELFRQVANHQPYACPHCRQPHRWYEVRCKQRGENILGQSIYTSVPDDVVGPLLFEETDAGLAVYRPDSNVILLPDGRAAVSQGGRVRLFQWLADTRRWAPDEKNHFLQYHSIKPHLHVVVL